MPRPHFAAPYASRRALRRPRRPVSRTLSVAADATGRRPVGPPARAAMTAALAAAGLGLALSLLAPAASGQSSRSVDPGPARLDGPATAPDRSPQSRADDASRRLAPQTVVLTQRPQRPLRTFRGQTVRIGSYAETEKSIGVVRPLRTYPIDDYRTGITRPNRFGDAERWTTRYVAPGQIVLQAYPQAYGYTGSYGLTGPERSIGVVRAYRLPDRPQRFKPVTFRGDDSDPTNPDAMRDSARDTNATGSTAAPARDVRVTAVADVSVPDELADDGWALLNAGYYREARRYFDQADADASDNQTGRALAAALSGDLSAVDQLLPASAALPGDVTLSDATRRRLQQTTQYLLADRPELQARLQTLLDQAPQAY